MRIDKLEKHLHRLSTHVYLKMQSQINTNRFISDSILHINLGFLQLSDLEDNIRNILTIVDNALNNKISTTMISPKQAKEELSKIQISGYEPVIKTLEEFYSLTSYATIEEEMLNVYISIPLINPSNKYELYQFVDAPLTYNNMLVRLTPTKDLLAIGSKDNLYTELREADLTSCLTVGRLKLCPHIRLFQKSGRSDDSCLFNLFIGQFNKAKCDGEIKKVSEVQVNIIHPNKIAVTAQNNDHNGILECPSNTSTGQLRTTIPAPKGVSIVKIEDGCSYQISQNYLFPNKKTVLKFNSHVNIGINEDNIQELVGMEYPTLVEEVLNNQDIIQIKDINDQDKLFEYLNSTQFERLQKDFGNEDYISYSALVLSIIVIAVIITILTYLYISSALSRCFPPQPTTQHGVEARDELFDDPEDVVQRRSE